MAAYILRRLALMIPTLLGILMISFAIIQFAPGGPVERIIAQLQGQDQSANSRVGGGAGDIAAGAIADASSTYRGAQGLDPAFIKELEKQFNDLITQQREILVKNEWDRIYTTGGASGMNAFTSTDLTGYFITVPANKLELWMWMESERILRPVFREFYAERDVVFEERRMRTESQPIKVATIVAMTMASATASHHGQSRLMSLLLAAKMAKT